MTTRLVVKHMLQLNAAGARPVAGPVAHIGRSISSATLPHGTNCFCKSCNGSIKLSHGSGCICNSCKTHGVNCKCASCIPTMSGMVGARSISMTTAASYPSPKSSLGRGHALNCNCPSCNSMFCSLVGTRSISSATVRHPKSCVCASCQPGIFSGARTISSACLSHAKNCGCSLCKNALHGMSCSCNSCTAGKRKLSSIAMSHPKNCACVSCKSTHGSGCSCNSCSSVGVRSISSATIASHPSGCACTSCKTAHDAACACKACSANHSFGCKCSSCNSTSRRWMSSEAKVEDAKEEEPTAGETAESVEETQAPPEKSREVLLEEQVKDLKDQLLRSYAEQENTRKIAARDVESAKQFAIKSFAKSLLDVSDNLTRALESVPEEKRKEDQVLTTLFEGIEMTDRNLQKAFEMNGLQKFGQVGEPFDPNKHDALYEYVDPEKEAGSVGQIMKPGFTLHKRVLRPAEVGVVKAS